MDKTKTNIYGNYRNTTITVNEFSRFHSHIDTGTNWLNRITSILPGIIRLDSKLINEIEDPPSEVAILYSVMITGRYGDFFCETSIKIDNNKIELSTLLMRNKQLKTATAIAVGESVPRPFGPMSDWVTDYDFSRIVKNNYRVAKVIYNNDTNNEGQLYHVDENSNDNNDYNLTPQEEDRVADKVEVVKNKTKSRSRSAAKSKKKSNTRRRMHFSEKKKKRSDQ
jgi:hypothetical protein